MRPLQGSVQSSDLRMELDGFPGAQPTLILPSHPWYRFANVNSHVHMHTIAHTRTHTRMTWTGFELWAFDSRIFTLFITPKLQIGWWGHWGLHYEKNLGLFGLVFFQKEDLKEHLKDLSQGIENRCALWIPRSRTSQQVIGKVFLTVKSFLRASICNLLERWWDSRPWASQMSDLLGRHVRQKAGRRDVRSSSPEVLKSFWVQDVYFGLSDKCLCLLGVRFHKQ